MEATGIARIIRLDALFALIGVITQWAAAHYARHHALGYFSFSAFLVVLFGVFVVVALPTFRSVPSLRGRIIIFTCGLWVITAFVALCLWLNIYGS